MAGQRAGRSLLVPLVGAVVGLSGIVVYHDTLVRHHLEGLLTDRTKVALSTAGIPADVRFVGRDGTVRVDSADQQDQARKIVLGIDGVRVVTVDAKPAVAAPVAPSSAAVKLLVDSGKAVLTGTVPAESFRATLVDAAKATFGADNVQDELTVDAKFTATGLAGLSGVLDALGKETKAGVVDLKDGNVTLTGTVVSQDVKDKAEAAAKRAIDSGTVTDDLVVGQAAPQQVQTQLVALPTVEFEFNSATLTAQGQAVVANVASILKTNLAVKVSIEGHTDGTGSAAANLVLSQNRARTVLDTLVSLGIAADRLTSTGFGSTRPKVPEVDATTQAINRRVEFIVQP